jgi:ATP-dependent DNA helicase RecQ
MRLLGHSFAAQSEGGGDVDFDALIVKATQLLRGEQVPPGLEADEVRDRLLAGFQHILVDEYQDIDQPQYEMISAIAGRTLDDADQKLSILAVGDDDQNIYTFRGANVRFIRQFQQDYDAEVHYLVENYRSTRHIIEATNLLIAANKDRMKTAHPIRIDRRRRMLDPGGEFARMDLSSRGKVRVIEVAYSSFQAQAVLDEIRRLNQIGASDWSGMAVLSREHADLAPIRALAERESIPIRWVAGRNAIPPLHRIRELHGFLKELGKIRNEFKSAGDLLNIFSKQSGANANPWTQYLGKILHAWRTEAADAELPVQDALEFIYEACAENRREFTFGDGVTLSTVHSAKGTEFDHVLVVGPWRSSGGRHAQEEERRAFYVGLTRAKKSLAIIHRIDVRQSLAEEVTGPGVIRYAWNGEAAPRETTQSSYEMLSMEDLHLGFAGYSPKGHPVHNALATLQPDDKVQLRHLGETGVGVFSKSGICVARLSRKAEAEWSVRLEGIREVRVLAMVCRDAAQDLDLSRRVKYKAPEWEVPILEVVFERP